MKHAEQIPVFLLTGFLGAGKTTLLNRMMQDPAFQDTALIINEFGSIAVDHHLVHKGDEQVMVTTTGCICCTIGSDLRSSLNELLTMRKDGSVPPFRRVIVETTGLACPAPIINSLIPGGMQANALRDHWVARAFHLSSVITVVDVQNIEHIIAHHPESQRQIAFADHLVLTHMEESSDDYQNKLRALNGSAHIYDASADAFNPTTFLAPGSYSAFGKGENVSQWLNNDMAGEQDIKMHEDIVSIPLTRKDPVSEAALHAYLTTLTSSTDNSLLRVKGLVALEETPNTPALVHVVGNRLYPIKKLDAWPEEQDGTRLMVIGTNLDESAIRTGIFQVPKCCGSSCAASSAA